MMMAKAGSLLQRADIINATDPSRSGFAKATEMQFIATNAPFVFQWYLDSMDAYVQVGVP